MKTKNAVLFLLLIACYAIDPYSWGQAGYKAVFSGREWQIGVTVALTALLIISWFLSIRAQPTARRILELETVGFVLLNIAYTVRDGESRFVFGYEHRPIGLVVVIVGLACRIILGRLLVTSAPRGLAQPISER